MDCFTFIFGADFFSSITPGSLDPQPRADIGTHHGAAHSFFDLSIFINNARLSLNERLVQLIYELEFVRWDCILFSETRTPSNAYQIEGGHRLIQNVAHGGCSGIAFVCISAVWIISRQSTSSMIEFLLSTSVLPLGFSASLPCTCLTPDTCLTTFTQHIANFIRC